MKRKALGAENSIVLSYLSDSYSRCSELQRVMEMPIAEVLFSNLHLGVFVRVTRDGVVEGLSLDRMIPSCKSRGVILCVLYLFIKEWFSFGTLRQLNGMNVNPVLEFVAVELLCEVDWSALGEQCWLPYD